MVSSQGIKKSIVLEDIFPQIEEIKNLDLRKQVEAVWQELWQLSQWCDFDEMPTSKEISYPAKPHSQCVLTMSLAIADALHLHHGIKIDKDILIAAAILQDASKTVEYFPDQNRKALQTPIGTQFPHAFWCAHVALNQGVPLEICHIIMTHSPSAAKFPQSLEGKILYYADQLDVIAIFGDKWVKHLMLERERS